ncbi:MAG: rhodanese-like domain-containing protein [Saccharofermentanales bacterium]
MKKSLLILSSLALPFSIFGFGRPAETTNADGTARPSYKKINAKAAKEIMDSGEKVTVLDVRTRDEFQQGHIKGAVHIPYDQIPAKASGLLPDKNAKILVYCASGARSSAGTRSLVSLGYADVSDFGGLMSWPYEVVR